MPHDGQDMTLTATPVLADLRQLTAQTLPAVDNILANAKAALRTMVTKNDRISAS